MQAVDRDLTCWSERLAVEGRFGRPLQKGGRDVEHIGSLGGKWAPWDRVGG